MTMKEPFFDNNFKKQIIISRLSDLNLVNVYCFESTYNKEVHFMLFYRYKDIVFARHLGFGTRRLKVDDLSFDLIERECRTEIEKAIRIVNKNLFSKQFKNNLECWSFRGGLSRLVEEQKICYGYFNIYPKYGGTFTDCVDKLIRKHIVSDLENCEIYTKIMSDLKISQERLCDFLNDNVCLEAW